MYSLNVPLPSFELSPETSDDEERLHTDLAPSSTAGDTTTPSTSSAPPSGGKGQMITEALVFEAKTVRRAGIHIPPIEWKPDILSQRQPGLLIIAPVEKGVEWREPVPAEQLAEEPQPPQQ